EEPTVRLLGGELHLVQQIQLGHDADHVPDIVDHRQRAHRVAEHALHDLLVTRVRTHEHDIRGHHIADRPTPSHDALLGLRAVSVIEYGLQYHSPRGAPTPDRGEGPGLGPVGTDLRSACTNGPFQSAVASCAVAWTRVIIQHPTGHPPSAPR